MNYRILLRNCAFFARHGVLDAEEQLGQRFFVDAELTVASASALTNDSIAETVDYGVAFQEIERIVTGQRRRIDLGRLRLADGTERYFLMWCGIGLDAAISQGQLGGEWYRGQWQDVGTPERLRALDAKLSNLGSQAPIESGLR